MSRGASRPAVSYPNVCPTSPGAKVAFPSNLPLLAPTASFAFPSPFHQLTRPDGADTQLEFVGLFCASNSIPSERMHNSAKLTNTRFAFVSLHEQNRFKMTSL